MTLASWERWMQQYRDAAERLIHATTDEERRQAKADITAAAHRVMGEAPEVPP